MSENDGQILIETAAEELRFKGRVIVFVNGTTFSSSAVFAMIAKANGFGSLWGEPCGSNTLRYGKRTIVPLPQIEMAASYSTAIWGSADPENKEKFIEPDVLVYQTINHYLEGEDALWDYFARTTKE